VGRRSDLVARPCGLVADGVVDREGVAGLAAGSGTAAGRSSARCRPSWRRPAALARRSARRPHAAAGDDVAAAGESRWPALRQRPAVQRHRAGGLAARRRSLRARRRHGSPASAGTLVLRLPYRAPLWPDSLFGHLAATACPGVEEWRDGAYRRTLRLEHGPGRRRADAAARTPCAARLALRDLRDLPAAVARCRRLLDLDADPGRGRRRAGGDPLLAPAGRGAPAGACRARSTSPSWPCAPCSASR
jgi:AraC family transcriptional regulator of adaptative response / DNA-3-methyladenine glycosylase II